jgi:ribosomal protein L17
VLWVTTVPLSSVKHAIEDQYKSRIGRTTPLTKEEQAYLALAIHFSEIFNRTYDSEEALFLLEKIGIPLDYVIKQIKGIISSSTKAATANEGETRSNTLASWLEETAKITEREKKPERILTEIKTNIIERQETQNAYAKAKEINNVLSTIITKASEVGRTWSNKDTIIREAKKKLKINENLSKEDEEQFDAIIDEIANRKGLKITPTRIYFKV